MNPAKRTSEKEATDPGFGATSARWDNWFAVQLRPNMRLIAERNLLRQGYPCFSPTRLETIRRANRYKTDARPLFPGYLFVQFDPRRPGWQAINATRGVSRIVTGPGQAPQPLPPAFIAGLQSRCDDDGRFVQDLSLNVGDTVRVLAGPFAGMVSRIDRLEPQDRVNLLIRVMGRDVRTSVSGEDVDRTPHPIPA